MELSTAIKKGAVSPYAFAGMYYTKPESTITAEMIVAAVCSEYGLAKDQVFRKTRKRSIVLPRQLCMKLIYVDCGTKMSLKDIGAYFGGLDHTTVIHSKTTVDNLRDTEPAFAERIEKIRNKYNNIQS